jgi:uncharacterized protein
VISSQWRNKIIFAFRRVWQVNTFDGEHEKLTIAYNLLRKDNYKMRDDLVKNFVPCYASRKYCNTISFNGNVYKCTAKESLHKDSLGYLDENGIIQWHIKNFENIYYKSLFNNSECLKCKYLPICMGPCPKKYEINKFRTPNFYCNRQKTGLFKIEDSILNYCIDNS